MPALAVLAGGLLAPPVAVAAEPGTPTRVAFSTAAETYAATTVREGVLRTADPAGRQLRLERTAGGWAVSVVGEPAGVRSVELTFAARRGERWLGFGERSDAVARRRGTVENWVSEGPYASDAEYQGVSITVPPWSLRRSRDATYYPMPWLLSTRGYGVLIDETERSRFRLSPQAWTAEVDAPSAALTVFEGARPAQALRAMTAATGRQPAPSAPWLFGPWFQTGHQNDQPREGEFVETLRAADAPFSAVETHMRYLPCEASLGREAEQRARTAALHAQGAAALTYLNNELCADAPLFETGAPLGAFQRTTTGEPYVFTAYVGGRGATPIVQFDFSDPDGVALFQAVLDRTAADGYDGFMEDYGEYTPPDSVSANGMSGLEMHNLYPVLYHRAGQEWADRQARPQVRWVRSGWTGSARYSEVVWGGDPTTGWGFDGLRSSVRNALTMGLSGVSTWGSDIGGFFTLGDQRLTPELLARWIQLGVVSGVMRTKAEGIGMQPMEQRPQIWEQPTLPIWRRYAKLRTQLYPYLAAADAEYRRTGLPIMRALVLADPRGARVEDAFLFGGDLLAAPVLEPGARQRRVWLPRGAWVDLWRAVDFERESGGLRLARAARVVPGRRTVRMRAPLDELPLQVRAGAVLPLLAPDVDTLADYGTRPGLVKLADRRAQLGLLAFPRGASSGGAYAGGRWTSREGRDTWSLDVTGTGASRVDLQASLRTLRRPFAPCGVRVGGRTVPAADWSYDRRAGVLRVTYDPRDGALRVTGC